MSILCNLYNYSNKHWVSYLLLNRTQDLVIFHCSLPACTCRIYILQHLLRHKSRFTRLAIRLAALCHDQHSLVRCVTNNIGIQFDTHVNSVLLERCPNITQDVNSDICSASVFVYCVNSVYCLLDPCEKNNDALPYRIVPHISNKNFVHHSRKTVRPQNDRLKLRAE